MPLEWKQSLNHWFSREVPALLLSQPTLPQVRLCGTCSAAWSRRWLGPDAQLCRRNRLTWELGAAGHIAVGREVSGAQRGWDSVYSSLRAQGAKNSWGLAPEPTPPDAWQVVGQE